MSNLFRKELVGVRFGPGAYIKGRWVEGDSSVINFMASVQPTTAHDLQFLEIARRERKTYTLYTDFKLLALTTGTKNPDCVDIDNERYEVTAEAPWRNNVISHYKYIIVLCNAVEDHVPVPMPAPELTDAIPSDSRVTISFSPVIMATSYNLYYAEGSTVDKLTGTKIQGVTSPHSVESLVNGTQYAFAVTSLHDADESDLSNIVTATPNV